MSAFSWDGRVHFGLRHVELQANPPKILNLGGGDRCCCSIRMQSFTFCLSMQLDTIKFKAPAAYKPPVQKVDNGGIRMDNGFLQSTLYLQHFALISLQFVNGWRACQRFSVNFVMQRPKFSCQTSENSA